jgi:hypothetical protein
MLCWWFTRKICRTVRQHSDVFHSRLRTAANPKHLHEHPKGPMALMLWLDGMMMMMMNTQRRICYTCATFLLLLCYSFL